jgi:WD repeat-containing protein 48
LNNRHVSVASDSPTATSTSEVTTRNQSTPDLTIRGGPSIRTFQILNDKRLVLTKDTDNNVAVYDVLKAVKVSDLGQVDLEEEVKRRTKNVYVPNWFNVDLKTGVSCIRVNCCTQISDS